MLCVSGNLRKAFRMKAIEYYFSVLSPFTHLAGDQLEQIASRHGAAVNYKPIDIMGLFGRTGGVAPKDRHESRKAYRLQDLARIGKLAKIDINLTPAFWPADPVPASCAIVNAVREGSGDVGALARNVLRACWAQDRNIADPDVVAECLAAAGFPAELAVADDMALTQFSKNTDEAVRQNVFGSPTYVVGDQVFWGQDRLGHLDALLSGRLG